MRCYFSGNRDIGGMLSQLGGLWISGGNVFVLREVLII